MQKYRLLYSLEIKSDSWQVGAIYAISLDFFMQR
jgi:hypothetical protein